MTQTQLSGIFARAEMAALQEMAEAILATGPWQVLQPPTTGMVMMQVTEVVEHQPFFVGDLLVTECEVQVGGFVARGYVLGEDPDRAFHAAIVQAALADPDHPLRPRIDAFLTEQAERIAAHQGLEEALVSRTKVHFDTLEDQDAQHKGSHL